MNLNMIIKNPRVLITEDDLFTANIFRDFFTRENFEVIVAYDGKQAIEMLKQHSFDAVLLDLMLPGIGGIGVLQFIRTNDQLQMLPVVILSNTSYFSGLAQSARNAGGTSFIEKAAVNPQKLVDEVRNLIAISIGILPASALRKSETDVQSAQAAVHAQPTNFTSEASAVPASVYTFTHPINVLLADDDRLIHGVIKFFMTQAGHNLESAYDGREAIEMALVKRPDILILDGVMPDYDGVEVVERWQKDPSLSHIPIILITSDQASIRKISEIYSSKITMLMKPFSPEKLVAKIQELALKRN